MRGTASLFLLCAATLVAGPALARVGVTSVTDGEPRGQPPTEAERVLRVGIDVQANERVTTRADDRAHLVFLDGTSLSVGPNSVLMIDKYVYDPDRKVGEMTISTTRGVFRFVGGAISKGTEVQIKTPSATIGIRGGIVQWSHSEAGAVKAILLYGVSLTVKALEVTQIATRNGSQIDVPPGGRPGPVFIVPPGNLMGDRSFERQSEPASQPQAAERQQQFQPQAQPQLQPQPQPQVQPQLQPQQQRLQLAVLDRIFDGSKFSEINSGAGVEGPPSLGPRNQGGKGREAIRTERGPSIPAGLRLGNVANRDVAKQQPKQQTKQETSKGKGNSKK
jgi:hypothetical protein